MGGVKGRTVVITGGAGNNGLACMRVALSRGMNVAFMSSCHSKAQEAVEKLAAENPAWRSQMVGFAQNPQARIEQNMREAPDIYQADTTQEDVLRMIALRFGGIDVVINGSGGHERKNFFETDKQSWQHSMEVVEGAFFNTKLAYPYLLKSPAARVINLTTFDGRAGGYVGFFDPSFAAARGGVVALTQELARELGPKGITVNCVAIGHIEGDVPAQDTLSNEHRLEMLAATPLNRLGKPEDIAGAVNFLMSDEAAFITGAVIDVNGGVITTA